MTLKEFSDYLLRQMKLHPNNTDDTVVILNDIPHVGPPPSIEITGVRIGFDWERGLCILTTKSKVIAK